MNNISRRYNRFYKLLMLSIVFLLYTSAIPVNGQIPTVDVPTVTSSPMGVVVSVKYDEANPQINVRAGPGTEYDKVGTMVISQKAPAKGRTEGGNWILIEYPGGPGGYAWVYSTYVEYLGELPIVTIPNTPTPKVTNTTNPTFAAQFMLTQEPTRLSTFTAPAPLIIPTFQTVSGVNIDNSIPMGMIILSCLMLGVIIGLFTMAQKQ